MKQHFTKRRSSLLLTDKVAILEVEAVELVTGLFGVHYVVVDDKGRALGVVGDALPDLPDAAEFAEKVEELFGGDVVAEVFDEEGSVEWEVSYGYFFGKCGRTNLLTSGASFPARFILIVKERLGEPIELVFL